MDEAENCDRIAIIDHGRIIALDTPARLKAQVQGDCIHLETADDTAAEAEVKQRYGVEVVRDATGLHFEVENGAVFVPGLLRDVSVAVRTVSVRPPTLEDVFLKMTGREIRDDEASNHEKLRARLQRMGRAWR
jgi:ABC-2 type transport system ATP-binding protein